MENILTNGQEDALKKAIEGNNIFISGDAGAGKSFLVELIKAKKESDGKKVVVTASTGMAAQNYEEGRTIHSLTSFRPGEHRYDYSNLKPEFMAADVIVVDEVSMLAEDIMYHIYKCLATKEKDTQLIFVGDFFQLPPVYPNNRTLVYPFELDIWKTFNFQPCILTECVRQKDQEFVDNLRKLKYGNRDCISYFHTHTSKKEIPGAITLCATNEVVNKKNRLAIDELKKVTGAKSYFFPAIGRIENANFKTTNVEKNLELVRGMRVMILRNDSNRRYHNGSLGIVQAINDDCIVVKLDNKNVVEVSRVTYYVDNKDKSKDQVAIEQFPLRAGYAVTIHKSQGQTFDKVNIEAVNCWAPGQLYVAMSRCKSVENIYLKYKINPSSIITDAKVINYYYGLEGGTAA